MATEDAPSPESAGQPGGGSAASAAARDLTELLAAARAGDPAASGPLYERVYGELKRLARAQLGAHGRAGATLHTTALAHEAYLRLAGGAELAVADRAHFFNLAARIMRHVIVDFARRRDALRRGGEAVAVELDAGGVELADPSGTLSVEVLALERVLESLEATSPALARLVELRFFVGFEIEELVPLVGRSERSLKRDWRRAQAFLRASLDGDRAPALVPPVAAP